MPGSLLDAEQAENLRALSELEDRDSEFFRLPEIRVACEAAHVKANASQLVRQATIAVSELAKPSSHSSTPDSTIPSPHAADHPLAVGRSPKSFAPPPDETVI